MAVARAGARFSDYLQLTKPGIVSLILLTAAATMAVAARWPASAPGAAPWQASGLDPWLLAAVMVGLGLASAGGGVLNCYIDRDIDAVMRRTAKRPIPAGRVGARQALALGLALSGTGLAIMGAFTNLPAALLTVAGLGIYVGVYSLWLKRRTAQNIVIGGAAGALGPVIGWAAVRGDVSWLSLVLFLIIFLWTPPHFWALALLGQEDYRRAGVPMLPVVAGEGPTRRQILVYTVLLALVSLLPPWLGAAGATYLLVAALAGGAYVVKAVRAYRRPSREGDRGLFRYSISYLALVFTALVVSSRFGI